MKRELQWFWCSLLAYTPTAASIQYCANDSSQGAHFCMSMALFQNSSSSGWDLYLTLGVVDRPGEGWMAVGIGERMAESLMFIVATDEMEQQIVTTRTTIGHFPPDQVPAILPSGAMISTNSVTPGWRQTSIVCYSCDKWEKLQPRLESRPWIWAYNGYQKIERADEGFRLEMHNTLGLFYVNMTEATGGPGEHAAPPPLDASRGSYATSSAPIGDTPAKEQPSLSAKRWHGILLCTAFVILYPAGAVAAQLKVTNMFWVHVILQMLGSVACLVGVALQAPTISHAGTWRTMTDAHPFLGALLACLTPLQIFLGYWHHLKLSQRHRKPAITSLHVWTGRFLLATGTLNIGMGLAYAKESTISIYIWGLVAIFEVVLFVWLLPKVGTSSPMQKTGFTATAISDGAAAHLLEFREEDTEL